MIPAALRVRAAPGERARAGPRSAPLPPVSGPHPAPGDLRPPQDARGATHPRAPADGEDGGRPQSVVVGVQTAPEAGSQACALGPGASFQAACTPASADRLPGATGTGGSRPGAGLCNVCVPPASLSGRLSAARTPPEADTARNRLCINTAGSTREVLTTQEQNFTTEARSVSSEPRRQPRGSERGGDAVSLCSQRCLLQSTWFWEEASWQEERPLPHGRPSGGPAGPWHSRCAPEPSGGGPSAEPRLPGGCAPRASAGVPTGRVPSGPHVALQCSATKAGDRQSLLAGPAEAGWGRERGRGSGILCLPGLFAQGQGATEREGLPAPPARVSQRWPRLRSRTPPLTALPAWPPAAFQLSIGGSCVHISPGTSVRAFGGLSTVAAGGSRQNAYKVLHRQPGLLAQATRRQWPPRSRPSSRSLLRDCRHTVLAKGEKYKLLEVSPRTHFTYLRTWSPHGITERCRKL